MFYSHSVTPGPDVQISCDKDIIYTYMYTYIYIYIYSYQFPTFLMTA